MVTADGHPRRGPRSRDDLIVIGCLITRSRPTTISIPPSYGLSERHHRRGASAGPGEITVAHRSVPFLDELLEFNRRALEALREPLETGRVAISRVGAKTEYPAHFQLIIGTNPCPCGHTGSRCGRSRCKPAAVEQYRARLSGPLLDRLDLRVMLESVGDADLAEHR